MKTIFKFLSLIFTILFIWAVYLQYNDPDATIWYAIYGVAALASLLFFLNKFRPILGVLLGILYLGGTIYIWPEKFEGVTIGEGDIVNIERGREALGLLITALIMFVFAWRAKKS